MEAAAKGNREIEGGFSNPSGAQLSVWFPKRESIATIELLAGEGAFNADRHGLVAERALDADFNARFGRTPVELVDARVRGFGVELGEVKAGGSRVDEERILVGLVFNKGRHRAEPVVAAFLAVFPDLLDGHLFLVDLVDHAARVLHVGQRRLFERTAVAVVEHGHVDRAGVGLRVDAPAGVLRPRPVEAAFAAVVFALQGLAVLVDRRQHLLGEVALPAGRGGFLSWNSRPRYLLASLKNLPIPKMKRHWKKEVNCSFTPME